MGEIPPADAEVITAQPGAQTSFLQCTADFCIFAGTAGSAKSYSLLLDSLYGINDPYYTAIIFRRKTTHIRKPGGLWDTSRQIYTGRSARGRQNDSRLETVFPTGCAIKFDHLELEKTADEHQGGQYAFIGFDEITEFTKYQVFYLISRNRTGPGCKLKHAYARGTCNPDARSWLRLLIDWYVYPAPGVGTVIPERAGVLRYLVIENNEYTWVEKDWYKKINGQIIRPRSFTVIGATRADNPKGRESDPNYESALYSQDEVTKARLLFGDWNAIYSGGMIDPDNFIEIELEDLPKEIKLCRYYDMAKTKSEEKEHGEPASTAAALTGTYSGDFYIVDVKDWMETPGVIEDNMKKTAKGDGYEVLVSWEEEKGSAGGYVSNHLHKDVFSGYECRPDPVSGDKVTRAKPWVALSEHHHVYIVKGAWNAKFKIQCGNFPNEGFKRDQVDAVSGGYKMLMQSNKVWPGYQYKHFYDPINQINLNWSAMKREEVVIIVNLVGDRKFGVYGVFCLWGRKTRRLYVYGEIVEPSVVIDSLAESLRSKCKVSLQKAQGMLSVDKLFFAQTLAAGGDDVRKLLRKSGIRGNVNPRADEIGNSIQVNSMFNQDGIFVSRECPETDRQIKEWTFKEKAGGRPQDGFPLCKALCGVVTELKDMKELEKEAPPKPYSYESRAQKERFRREVENPLSRLDDEMVLQGEE